MLTVLLMRYEKVLFGKFATTLLYNWRIVERRRGRERFHLRGPTCTHVPVNFQLHTDRAFMSSHYTHTPTSVVVLAVTSFSGLNPIGSQETPQERIHASYHSYGAMYTPLPVAYF